MFLYTIYIHNGTEYFTVYFVDVRVKGQVSIKVYSQALLGDAGDDVTAINVQVDGLWNLGCHY